MKLALSEEPYILGVSSSHPRTEADQVSEKLCSLVFYNTGRWTKSKNPVILSVMHHRQNPLESTRFLVVSDTVQVLQKKTCLLLLPL
jgi:hypothetical protein